MAWAPPPWEAFRAPRTKSATEEVQVRSGGLVHRIKESVAASRVCRVIIKGGDGKELIEVQLRWGVIGAVAALIED
ncbi:DUF4342 domain-containing protein [Chloroflexota bacterium]